MHPASIFFLFLDEFVSEEVGIKLRLKVKILGDVEGYINGNKTFKLEIVFRHEECAKPWRHIPERFIFFDFFP